MDIYFKNFYLKIYKKSIFKFETPNRLVQTVDFLETGEKQVIIREVNQDGDLIEVRNISN